jgi:hypothetical protein
MSVLPAEVHTALAGLLQGLQSPDNVQRTNAEQQLNEEWVAQRPEVLLMGLSEQIELAQDTSVGTPAFLCFTLLPNRERHPLARPRISSSPFRTPSEKPSAQSCSVASPRKPTTRSAARSAMLLRSSRDSTQMKVLVAIHAWTYRQADEYRFRMARAIGSPLPSQPVARPGSA